MSTTSKKFAEVIHLSSKTQVHPFNVLPLSANLEEGGLGVQQTHQGRGVQLASGPRSSHQEEEARVEARPGHQRAVREEAREGQRLVRRAKRLETPTGGGKKEPRQKGETT